METNTTAIKATAVTSLPLGLGTPHAQPQMKSEPAAQPQAAEKPITEKDLQKAIADISKNLSGSNVSIGFNY